ncbi:MAG TPA: PBP1A family penicillin-binding protein [Gemmatimonadales bacterium]|nr:PBP1A family penicillin-binding protein [Gemmatimonadales bacterium]
MAWTASCGFRGCPSVAEIQRFRPSEGSRVLDRSGAMLGRLTYVRRLNVPLERVPKTVRAAFIATEDRRFYAHHGVDWRGALRALWRNLTHLDVREGFSTITMQVVRSAFFPELASERSFGRKLIEVRLARRLEASLGKQRILELYLNVIYLGNGTYGVEAASRDLFGKDVAELTLAQAATLAALPKSPAGYAPRRHPDRALRRRNLVLALMRDQGYITPAQAQAASRAPLGLSARSWQPRLDTTYALDPVRAFVDSVLGDRELEGDVTVYTTLDATAQAAAERAVRTQAAAIERASGATGRKTPPLEGALVALDPLSGEIRALVGARRYAPGGFNRALAARRQPGSTFKPFVYAVALHRGYTPGTLVDDEPVEVPEADGTIWRPANYDGTYAGRTPLRRALMRSANVATVRVGLDVGLERVAGFAREAGIASPLPPVPSLALGSAAVTPLELVAAYAPFANGGFRVRPSLVRRIAAADGSVLWERKLPTPPRVMDPREAFQLTSMLESVVDQGTGRAVRDAGVTGAVAGKTGTTNDGTDVWFVGYTPSLVAGVWFGYDQPRPIARQATGGRLAAPAWASFYLRGWAKREPATKGWEPPPGLVMREVDALNGLLATQYCPLTQREWFKEGTEPTETCPEHRGSLIDRVGGFLKRVFGF